MKAIQSLVKARVSWEQTGSWVHTEARLSRSQEVSCSSCPDTGILDEIENREKRGVSTDEREKAFLSCCYSRLGKAVPIQHCTFTLMGHIGNYAALCP